MKRMLGFAETLNPLARRARKVNRILIELQG
jgi:hypothetical protein